MRAVVVVRRPAFPYARLVYFGKQIRCATLRACAARARPAGRRGRPSASVIRISARPRCRESGVAFQHPVQPCRARALIHAVDHGSRAVLEFARARERSSAAGGGGAPHPLRALPGRRLLDLALPRRERRSELLGAVHRVDRARQRPGDRARQQIRRRRRVHGAPPHAPELGGRARRARGEVGLAASPIRLPRRHFLARRAAPRQHAGLRGEIRRLLDALGGDGRVGFGNAEPGGGGARKERPVPVAPPRVHRRVVRSGREPRGLRSFQVVWARGRRRLVHL